jgi:hypothetical protein
MTAAARFTPAELRFIGDRVRAEVAAHPSVRPYLGEDERAPAATCRYGHADWRERRNGTRYCGPCQAARKRERRAEGRQP